jgi:hypothetical protein
MMTGEMQTKDQATMMETVVVGGNLAALSPSDRLAYYRAVCESLGLNPLTKPFDYIQLNGRLTLYARRDATDQLRKIHGVSLSIVSRDSVGDVYVVTAKAQDRDGRSDESTGAVSLKGLAGEALANAYMKAETKAKRRVTLSLVGLGWLDEAEVAGVPSAQPVVVDEETGEIVTPTKLVVTKSETTQGTSAAGEKLFAVWIQDRGNRLAWWTHTEQELGLTHAEAYEALSEDPKHPITSLLQYAGTVADAQEAVATYINAHAALAAQEA